jgi:catechol 2,3-dioxygenase-like lactoylglutathione lyase family enzyme
MATLNHTNLTTYDVPQLQNFFCTIFGFEAVENRGSKLAVLRNSENFILTLMFDKSMTPEQGYPGIFHVGFIQPDEPAVDRLYQKFGEFKYDPPKPELLTRGGPPTYGFYYKAPGGVLVEVSTMNVDAPMEN